MEEKYQKYFKVSFPKKECGTHRVKVSLISTDDSSLLCTRCIKDYKGRPLQDLQQFLTNMSIKMRSQHLSINQKAESLSSAAQFDQLIAGVNEHIRKQKNEEEKKLQVSNEPLIDESQTLLGIYQQAYEQGDVKALVNVEKQTSKLAKEMSQRWHKVGKIKCLKDYILAHCSRQKTVDFLINSVQFLFERTSQLEEELKRQKQDTEELKEKQKEVSVVEEEEEPSRFSTSKAYGRDCDFIFRKVRKLIEKKAFGPSCCRLEQGVPLGKSKSFSFFIQNVAPGQLDVGFTTLTHFENVSCFLNYIYCIRHDSVYCNSKVISEAHVSSGDLVTLRVKQEFSFVADIELFLNNVLVCSAINLKFEEQLYPAVMLRNQGDIVEIIE